MFAKSKLKLYIYTMKAISFNSAEFTKMSNSSNLLNTFNGIVVYHDREVVAKSATLNGFEEFGSIKGYAKANGDMLLLVEFCGDRGIWNEFVNVTDCRPFNG